MSIALILMMNFKENHKKLEDWILKKTLTEHRFEQFHRRFENNLKTFFLCNDEFKNIFFLILSFNIPPSANIAVQILTGSYEHEYIFIVLYFVLINQLFLIFAIHYYLTKPINAIHYSSNILYTYFSDQNIENCNNYKVLNCRTMAKITQFLFTIHTKNYYGFTYANITLISMPTFINVS